MNKNIGRAVISILGLSWFFSITILVLIKSTNFNTIDLTGILEVFTIILIIVDILTVWLLNKGIEELIQEKMKKK